MTQKKILIVSPNALFPKTMMSQVRTINMLNWLHKEHIVDVASFCHDKQSVLDSKDGLKDLCRYFFPLRPINHKENLFKRKWYGIKSKLTYYFLGYSRRYTYYCNSHVAKQIQALVQNDDYDIIMVYYWFMGYTFDRLPKNLYKVIDTSSVQEEVMKSYANKSASKKLPFFEKRQFKRSITMQYKFFKAANLVVAISRLGLDAIAKADPDIDTMLVPIGQDIKHFSSYPTVPFQKTIIFYGTMGSQQNTRAFRRMWQKVMPLVQKEIPDIKLLVVGSNPPKDIQELHNGDSVIVTGFVDDPREYLAKANVLVCPLETGGGFRGRMVEVMAMGLPVVGTHNALDSLELTHGEQGFITDDDQELADSIIKLIQNPQLRQKISEAGKAFVTEKYSIENTFGKLIKHFSTLENKKNEKDIYQGS